MTLQALVNNDRKKAYGDNIPNLVFRNNMEIQILDKSLKNFFALQYL